MRHSRLELKISGAILVILVLGFGALAVIIVWQEARALRRREQETSALLASSVVQAIRNVMLQGRGDIAARFIDDLQGVPGLERIQLFRTDGREAFHDLQTFAVVRRNLERQAGGAAILQNLEEGIARHRARGSQAAPAQLAGPAFARVAETGETATIEERLRDRPVITYLTPLRNEVQCFRCHGADHEFRGVLAVSLSLEPVEAAVRASRNAVVAIAVTTILLVATALRTALERLVLRPLAAVASGMTAIAGGDLHRTIAVISRDEIGELAAHLNRMVEELRVSQEALVRAEKLSSLGRLASGLAHEINNPLASIAGYAEDLRDRLRASGPLDQASRDKVVEDLALIQEQAYRCKAITRSLLDFARQGPPRLAEADVNALVRQTADLLAAATRGARPRISTSLDQAVPAIVTDEAQLQQVLVNVLKNALDATEAGGAVEVTTVRDGDRVAITIRDGGCGIPPEHLPKIFDPFFTTKPAGVGTGLGLAITYRILEVLGGTIAVESRPGQGTTVRIALPPVPAVPAIRPDVTPAMARARSAP